MDSPLPQPLFTTAFHSIVIVYSDTQARRFLSSKLVSQVAYNHLDDGGYASLIMTGRRPNNRQHTFLGGSSVFLLNAKRVMGVNPEDVPNRVWDARISLAAKSRGEILVMRPPFPLPQNARPGLSYFYEQHGKSLGKALGYGRPPNLMHWLLECAECPLCDTPFDKTYSNAESLICCTTHRICNACRLTVDSCPYRGCTMPHVSSMLLNAPAPTQDIPIESEQLPLVTEPAPSIDGAGSNAYTKPITLNEAMTDQLWTTSLIHNITEMRED